MSGQSNLKNSHLLYSLLILLSFGLLGANYWDDLQISGNALSAINSATHVRMPDSVTVGSSTVSNANAILELNSVLLGFMPTRMTTTQRDAISVTDVDDGLYIWNTTTHDVNIYNSSLSTWVDTTFNNSFFVDVNIGGPANATLGTSAVTTYTDISNGSLAMTDNGSTTGVEITCAAGEDATGLTCTGGTVIEDIGIVFTTTDAGYYRACFEFSHNVDGTGSFRTGASFQIAETGDGSSVITNEGNSRVYHSHNDDGGRDEATPYNLCGTFDWPTPGQKVLRLKFEQEASGAGSLDTSEILCDQDTSLGQRDVHITIWKISNT